MEWRNFSARNRQRRPAGFIPPAQPTRAAHAPSGPEWVHEVKFDGFRIVAMKDNDRVRLWSRFGNDLTARFSAIRDAVAGLPIDRVLIDGEAVVHARALHLTYSYPQERRVLRRRRCERRRARLCLFRGRSESARARQSPVGCRRQGRRAEDRARADGCARDAAVNLTSRSAPWSR
ncbi:hypothetical protein [Methylocystis sp.]|uniref:ATP-dependent DNA ligase n=1 Tax=Methylocystis sp. TaxID=1911079 RepID=UPI003DA4CF37